MREKRTYVKQTQGLLDLFLKHKKPYYFSLRRKRWVCFPNVFSPLYSIDTRNFVSWLPDVKGKAVLEIGVGTGVISVFLALQGAKRVVGVDINPAAVRNAEANKKLHSVKNILFRLGDLFDPIKESERFDCIFFNAPFELRKKKLSLLERSVWDQNYSTLKRFLKTANKYLKPNGKIWLGFSTCGHIGVLKKLVQKNNYSLRLLHKKVTSSPAEEKPSELRFYELTPQKSKKPAYFK